MASNEYLGNVLLYCFYPLFLRNFYYLENFQLVFQQRAGISLLSPVPLVCARIHTLVKVGL